VGVFGKGKCREVSAAARSPLWFSTGLAGSGVEDVARTLDAAGLISLVMIVSCHWLKHDARRRYWRLRS
jgi:hypothetical protein